MHILLSYSLPIALFVAILLAADHYRVFAIAAPAKMLASTLFIALAWHAGAFGSLFGCFIFVGLIFSWWGDLFLLSIAKKPFLLGLIAFFLAHVMYIAAFWALRPNPLYAAITLGVLLIPAVIIYRWLSPALGGMRGPVLAYMAVISIMVASSATLLARGGTATLPVVGAVLFYLSDLFVARRRFVKDDAWNRNVGLPLYYLAQVILAASLLWIGA
jgi:uncharacterized membrane protein YhhN